MKTAQEAFVLHTFGVQVKVGVAFGSVVGSAIHGRSGNVRLVKSAILPFVIDLQALPVDLVADQEPSF